MQINTHNHLDAYIYILYFEEVNQLILSPQHLGLHLESQQPRQLRHRPVMKRVVLVKIAARKREVLVKFKLLQYTIPYQKIMLKDFYYTIYTVIQ